MVKKLLHLLLVTSTCTGMVGLTIEGWAADFPFRAGEKLVYRISWSKYLEAGSVELLTTQASPSTPGTLRLQLKATTTSVISSIYPFKDEFASLFDPTAGLPSHFEKNFVERKRIVRETVDFDHFGQSAIVFTPGNTRRKLPVEWGTQDPLSALYLIRGLTLKPGLQVSFPVLDGGKVYRVDLQVTGNDLISTQAGSFPSQRLEVRLRHGDTFLNDKRITLWVSNDDRKLPVLAAVNLNFGSVLIELTSRSN
ncbi:MAG TPA: DUF3108 domain-containing protein [Terriglobia bacterium]|nr:DUF3108 domain-containing protein [Terriglobia bacterium]